MSSQPTNRYRYEISSRLGILQVNPLGEANFQIEWTRQDDGRLEYKKALPSKVVFRDEPTNPDNAYRYLMKLEKSRYRCEFISITVQRKCTYSGSIAWIPHFSGRMSLNDCFVDESACFIEAKLTDVNIEQCYEDNKAKEVNILQGLPTHTVKLQTAGVTIETVSYSRTIATNAGNCKAVYWGGTGNPNAGGWIYYELEFSTDPVNNTCYMRAEWAREVILVDCSAPSPGSEWILVQDSCPSGQKKYARPARTFGCNYDYADPNDSTQHEYYTCNVLGLTGSNLSIDNCVRLDEVINLFVSQYCGGYTFVSNLLQINPDVISDLDYVTGLKSSKHNLVVAQKADVKRPNTSDNGTKAIWTMEKLFRFLTMSMNQRWEIESGTIRMEHVSYFQKSPGIDLSLPRYAPYIKAKQQYSYNTPDIPIREEFKWMEAKAGDFAGFPIEYFSACVGPENNVKTYSIEDVTTDVELCLNNPDSDSQVVSDSGFVVMACDVLNGEYYLITEAQIFGGSTLNNPLAWSHLHRDYYKYDRPLRQGYLNQALTTFITVQRTKKGAQISIPFCCDDTFDPDDEINGLFGPATVDKATFNFVSDMVDLDLLYDADYGIVDNQSPIANDDMASTYIDTPVMINVLANDSDPDGTIRGIVILLPPMHGTASVTNDNMLLYSPEPGYVGDDNISYASVDDYGQQSNNALVLIDVLAANTAPIANDDSYYTNKNTMLNVAAPGVFANDSDNQGFTLQSFTPTSAQGGTVNIANTGALAYNPANNFVGTDTATYTIVDSQGLTDTATVTIDVRDPNNPVANNDTYSTPVNTNLMVSAPGVLANDTTTIGSLSVVAASGSTSQGGTFSISANGSFSYNPASGFTGPDTFPYTNTNGTGTDTATVSINVLPQIYVRLTKENDTEIPLYNTCNGMQTAGGVRREANFRLSFFSNSAGTTPYDVSGLGLTVNYRVDGYDYSGNPYSNLYSVAVSGTTQLVFSGTYYRNVYNCSGAVISSAYLNQNYILNPGNYTLLS